MNKKIKPAIIGTASAGHIKTEVFAEFNNRPVAEIIQGKITPPSLWQTFSKDHIPLLGKMIVVKFDDNQPQQGYFTSQGWFYSMVDHRNYSLDRVTIVEYFYIPA